MGRPITDGNSLGEYSKNIAEFWLMECAKVRKKDLEISKF